MTGPTALDPSTVARTAAVHQDEQVQTYFRALLRRLGWPNSESSATLQTLGITSNDHGEGVTTVAIQLAVAAAAMTDDKRVLLVDAHLGRPEASKLFGDGRRGLADSVITGDPEAAQCHDTFVPRLSILEVGEPIKQMDQVYDSPLLAGLVDELKSQFDLVIFDMPPAGASHAPLRLAELLDGVLLVVQSHSARRNDACRTRDLLAHARVRLMGAVLNRRR